MTVVVFTATAAAIFYVLAGYPLFIALRARLSPKPVRKIDGHRQTVTVIVAVRNGARWLASKIESILAQDYPRDLLEILIVSDGSTDSTDQIAASYRDHGVRLLRVPAGGKPAALNAGALHAAGDLLFLTDVRQILQPDCLSRLVACMADPAVGVVSGDLRIAASPGEEERHTMLYWRYENWIRGNLAQLDSTIGATGPVYLIRRSLYTPIPSDSLLDDVFLPLSAHLEGYRLALDPEAIAVDEPADLRTEFQRKVRTQAGVVQLLLTFPSLFSRDCRVRGHFISLKIGRLLLPYLFVALFVSAAALPSRWSWWLAGPQALFWLLAVIDPLFAPNSLPKKITAFPRAFAVLVFSALCALKVLFVPAHQLWVEARPVDRTETASGEA
jgi:biofilm PGA synthesis N-glycosyltransferase PgaC